MSGSAELSRLAAGVSMKIHSVDLAILLVYFAATILVGLWVSKRGAKDSDSYFLGGKTLPWYMLGISDASGMFDITGTMRWCIGCSSTASRASGCRSCGPSSTRFF